MTTALELLNRIPAAFWGVVAGSFFSLGGVWITNRTAALNLRRQHAHDREMRNRDREMAMRRDIYLDAAEALAAGFYSVARFSDFRLEGNELTSDFLQKAPALAKVNIVAGATVLRAITTAEARLNAAFMRLHKERVAGIVAKRDLLLVGKRVESYLHLQTTAVGMMNEENLKGRPDPARWQGVEANFKFATAQLETDIPAQRELESKIQSEQIRVTALVAQELADLVESLVPAVSAVRHELDMPIDENELRQIFLEVAQRNMKALGDFISHMDREVAKHDPSYRSLSPSQDQTG